MQKSSTKARPLEPGEKPKKGSVAVPLGTKASIKFGEGVTMEGSKPVEVPKGEFAVQVMRLEVEGAVGPLLVLLRDGEHILPFYEVMFYVTSLYESLSETGSVLCFNPQITEFLARHDAGHKCPKCPGIHPSHGLNACGKKLMDAGDPKVIANAMKDLGIDIDAFDPDKLKSLAEARAERIEQEVKSVGRIGDALQQSMTNAGHMMIDPLLDGKAKGYKA
jgi:hypothetical protein